ncbi:hypothetical protein ACTPOK_04230 [Streptomyces inhibens]|uniref:hypothetical protein n=1 Tax=Streptomyces inhibens TaxID=2293571 RepID=UPI00402A8725
MQPVELEHPFTASPQGDRRAILHIDILLHPDDRALTGPELVEVGHRLARAAGIEILGDLVQLGVVAVTGLLNLRLLRVVG